MNRKFHIKKGDLVQVNAGEDKGKQGKVLEVFPDKERAIVEGINMISKHTKPNAKYPQGGIIKQEAPIHISNLNVIDPSTNKPTRIGRKKDEKGNLVRYAKKMSSSVSSTAEMSLPQTTASGRSSSPLIILSAKRFAAPFQKSPYS